MTIEPITDERLAEIKAGLEGVPEGEWRMEIETLEHVEECDEDRQQQVFVCSPATSCDCTVIATMGRAESIPLERKAQDAAHIARMNKPTVASMIARIERAEARVKALEEALVSIHNYHIPDMPSYYHGDDLSWAQRQHGEIRRRARAALEAKS